MEAPPLGFPISHACKLRNICYTELNSLLYKPCRMYAWVMKTTVRRSEFLFNSFHASSKRKVTKDFSPSILFCGDKKPLFPK